MMLFVAFSSLFVRKLVQLLASATHYLVSKLRILSY